MRAGPANGRWPVHYPLRNAPGGMPTHGLMSDKETQAQDTLRRDQAQRRRWGAIIACSYALDVAFLLAYAWIDAIPWYVPVVYGGAAAMVCLTFNFTIVRGWNLASSDPSLTVPFTCVGTGLQLLVVALAPQIT